MFTVFLRYDDKLKVKLNGISFRAKNDNSAPVLIKLFVNRGAMSTDDVASYIPNQEITLAEEDLEDGNVVKLDYVKFQRVDSLTIYVESNAGGEYTVLKGMNIFGQPIEGMDMSKLKKTG